MWMLWLFIWIILLGAVGAFLGSRKGRTGEGLFLGALLGPIGWLIIAVMRGDRIDCPACRERIAPDALICPRCQTPLANGFVAARNPLAAAAATPPPPRRLDAQRVRVSCDGKEIGDLDGAQICILIEAGKLTLADHYFDREMNAWITLDACPLISVGSED
jgi:hypothetical protein